MNEEQPQPPLRLARGPRDVEPSDQQSRLGDGTEINVRLMQLKNISAEANEKGRLAADPAIEDLPKGFVRRDVNPLDPPAVQGDEEQISVHRILRENRAASPEPELIAMPPRRRSRRQRDFLLVLAADAIVFSMVWLKFRDTPEIVGIVVFGLGFGTAVVGWLIYGMMDRY